MTTPQNNPLASGKEFPIIIKYSTPAIVALLISAIYNIVDRMFVGNVVSDTALAALSVCYPVTFIVVGIAILASSGGATLFSLKSGEQDAAGANSAFGNAFGLVIIAELILTVLLFIFSEPLLYFFGASENTFPLAKAYYLITVVGSVFQGLTFVFNDFTRVSGKVLLAMLLSASGAVTNIILDAWFIAGLGWGVEGAAIATVIGQIVSGIIGFVIIFSGHTSVCIKKHYFKLRLAVTKKIAQLGISLCIAQIAFGFISVVYNVYLGKYGGDIAISVYAIISSIMTFVIMPANGLSQGLQPIIGYNYGARNYKRVIQMMTIGCIISVSITTIIWALVQTFPRQLVNLFGGSNSPELLELGVTALKINFIFIPIVGFVQLCITFFQALGLPKPSIILTLIRQVVALVPFIIVLPKFFGVNGIFFAQPISDLIALMLSLAFLTIEVKELHRLQENTAVPPITLPD